MRKGFKHSEATKLHWSKVRKGKRCGAENSNWKGETPKCINCGKPLSRSNRTKNAKRCVSCNNRFRWKNPKYKKRVSLSVSKSRIKLGVARGERNPNWRGWTSLRGYNLYFNKQLKEQIRKRDNYTCQGEDCSMTEEEHIIVIGFVLSVHHIDYNKKNCNDENLITLCQQCNARANFNRPYWEQYYKEKIKEVYHQTLLRP